MEDQSVGINTHFPFVKLRVINHESIDTFYRYKFNTGIPSDGNNENNSNADKL